MAVFSVEDKFFGVCCYLMVDLSRKEQTHSKTSLLQYSILQLTLWLFYQTSRNQFIGVSGRIFRNVSRMAMLLHSSSCVTLSCRPTWHLYYFLAL